MIRVTSVFFVLIGFSSLASEDVHPPVWSQDKTAVAFCENSDTSVCYVICNDKVANVSPVERANLGKIGHYKYEKIVTYPISWESNNKFGCMFWFKTHAWVNGQRHTVKEPVAVSDGVYSGR